MLNPLKSGNLRLNVVLGFFFLEAHVHQLIDQRAGRVPKGRLGHVSVGFVQCGGLTPFGVGHTQHSAEELFYVLCTLNARDGTEDIGERTVPTFLQRFDGNNVLNGTLRIEQVDAVQLPLVSGGDCDTVLRDTFDVQQVLS